MKFSTWQTSDCVKRQNKSTLRFKYDWTRCNAMYLTPPTGRWGRNKWDHCIFLRGSQNKWCRQRLIYSPLHLILCDLRGAPLNWHTTVGVSHWFTNTLPSFLPSFVPPNGSMVDHFSCYGELFKKSQSAENPSIPVHSQSCCALLWLAVSWGVGEM